jgi:phospholipid-transporting ATPase
VANTTIIPLTFFENFRRRANLSFLLMAVLGFMPWSPVPAALQVLPLIFVIAVSMLKALIEDLFRHRNDRKYNSIRFEIFRSGRFARLPSSEIRPGDIIRVRNGKEIPSDCAVIPPSDPSRICFVNEVNLNGETAIKQRKALEHFCDLSVPVGLPSLAVTSRSRGHARTCRASTAR